MRFNTQQIVWLFGVSILLLALVLFSRTTPSIKKGSPEKQEAILNDDLLLAEAKSRLDSSQSAWITTLDDQRNRSENLLQEAEVIKLTSGTWYNYKEYLVSGYYAMKVAEILDDGQSWSIAGTTYETAFRNCSDITEKKFAANRSIECLGKARELDPDHLPHAVNEALMTIELSSVDPSTPPMKGIMDLRSLDQANPNNVLINMTLGRLSFNKTGDYEKAIPRFENVIGIHATNSIDIKLLGEAYFYLLECFKKQRTREETLQLFDKAIEATIENKEINRTFASDKERFEKNI